MPQGEPLVREVQLDTQPAQQQLSDLAAQIEQIFANAEAQISSSLADAISAAADTQIPINADTSSIPDEIAGAVDGVEAPALAIDADTQPLTSSVDEAISGLPEPKLAIDGDASGFEAAVQDAVASAEAESVEIPVDADTSGLEEGVKGVGNESDTTAAKVGILGGALAGLTKKFDEAAITSGATGGALKAIAPEAVAASGAIALTVESAKGIVETGAQVLGVLQQFHTTFGRFADDARNIDVAGLNDDLGDLAVSLGVDDEAALSAEARVGAFAQTLGLGQKQSAEFAKSTAAIAASVSSANPALGSLDSVMGRIAQTLARNPSGLRRLGIEVTPAEIDQLATKLGKVPETLSQGAKAALAVQIALKKVGDASDEVEARQKNSQVVIAATQERIKNLFEAFAVPIAEPILQGLGALQPAVEGLEPVFRFFGKTVGAIFGGIAKGLGDVEVAFGTTISTIGRALERANSLPGLGHLVPDDLGPSLHKFGDGLLDAGHKAQNFKTTVGEGGDASVQFGTATNGVNEALAQQAEVTPQAQAALDDYQASLDASSKAAEDFQKQVDDIANASVDALPTTKDAFDSWQQGISDSFGRVVDDQNKVKEAFDRAHAATTATGLEDAVKDYRAASKDLSTARQELEAASDPKKFLQNLIDQAAGIAGFTHNLQVLLSRGEDDLVAFLAKQGPVVGGELAKQLVNDPAIAQSSEHAIELLNAATEQQKQFMEQDAAPRIAASAAKVAQDAQDAYSKTLKFRIPTLVELGITADTINTDRRVSSETRARALDASRQFGTAFSIAGHTKAELDAAAITVAQEKTLPIAAKQHGESLGVDFGAGIAQGIEKTIPFILAGGDHAIDQLNRSMRRTSGAQSPAKLFAILGDDIAAGVALGITRSTPEAAAAGSALITTTRDSMVSPAQAPASSSQPAPGAPGAAAAAAPAGAPAHAGVVVQGPLVGEVNNNADPAHIAAEIAWRLS